MSIKKNYIYNTIYQIFLLITPLITAPYTARIFEADGVGVISYTASIPAYFILFASLGTASYGAREIAMHRDDKVAVSSCFWEIEMLSIITTGISLFCYFIFILVYKEYRIYFLILSISIVSVAFDVSWFFSGLEQFKYTITRNIIVRLLGIFLLFTVIKDKGDLPLYIAINTITNLLGTASMWLYIPKFTVKVKINFHRLKHHLKQTLVYFVPTIATSIYTVLDKTMIGVITGSSYENGYYEQCTKITKMALAVVTSLNTVMSTRMSYLYANGNVEEIKTRLKKSIYFTMLISIPVAVGIIGIAKDFIPLFLGAGYDKVVFLLYVYCPLIIIIAVSNCLEVQYLTPCGLRVESSKGLIVGACCNFFLNMILIPRYFSVGAAISSVIAELIITFLFIRLSKNFVSCKMIYQASVKPLLGALIMFAVVMAISQATFSKAILVVLEVASGILVYGVLMVLLKHELVMEYVRKWNQMLKKRRYH